MGSAVLSLLVACTPVDPASKATRDSYPGLPLTEGSTLWIDADPVSRPNQTADIDDVLAIRMLINAGAMIAGLSTTAGNASARETWRSAMAEFGHLPLHQGRSGKDCDNPAVLGMAHALERGPLTILALGPLTNVAQLLACHPELAPRIDRIIAVAGRRPGERFDLSGGAHGIELRDLNYEMDRQAFREVLTSGVPIDLVPFAAGTTIRLGYGDLAKLPERLRERAWSWALVLWFAGGGGSLPAFDQTAAALLLWPDAFGYRSVHAEAGPILNLARAAPGEGAPIRLCLPRKTAGLQRAIVSLTY